MKVRDVMRDVVFGAVFPRFDSGGRPIVEFSPQVKENLGIDSEGISSSLAHLYLTQPAVRTCVDFLALNIAHTKLKAYRRTARGREEVEPEHPLRDLLERPNAFTDGFDLIRRTIADLAIYGNAFWAKRRVNDRRALVPMPPIYVHPRGGSVVTGNGYYILDAGGGPVRLELDEVVHFKTYNPDDVRIGSSILESVRDALSEDVAASRHRRGFWNNVSRHDGVIERPAGAKWDQDVRDRFLEDWKNTHSGRQNAGKVVVLEDGMTFRPTSFSPKDSEFIAGREWTLDTVATAFHIPLAVLSRKDTATFASMHEFHTMVYVDTLGPWNALVEKAIGLQLVPDFDEPGLYVEFNIEEKMQGDFVTMLDALNKAIGSPHMSVNEGRDIRNLPRIDDPDFDVPAKSENVRFESEPEEAPTGELVALPDREAAALEER